MDARLDDNSGSSGSPGGGNFAAPADKGAQRRADMRRLEQERRRREAVSRLVICMVTWILIFCN